MDKSSLIKNDAGKEFGNIPVSDKQYMESGAGNFSCLGARNQVGLWLSYRPASLCSLATQFQARFLESIPRPIAGLKFSTQNPAIF
jgi:hypothetical protein